MKPKEAMCAHLGCDSLRDMEDSYRYQPKPRETWPMYSVDEWMYTYGTMLPQVPGDWELDPDQWHAKQANVKIWRHRRTS